MVGKAEIAKLALSAAAQAGQKAKQAGIDAHRKIKETSQAGLNQASNASKAGGALLLGAVGATAAITSRVPGVILIIVGFITHFWLKSQAVGLHVIAAWILLFVGSYLFFDHMLSRGALKHTFGCWVVVITFTVWYTLLGARSDSLLYVVIFLGLFSLFEGASQKAEGLQEIAIGFVPIVIFFLDVGYLSWFAQQLGLEVVPIFAKLISNMPWWALLGFLSLPDSTGEKSGTQVLITGAKIFFIGYLVLTFVLPFLPSFHSSSLLPSTEDALAASRAIEDRLPQGEHPFVSQLACIFDGGIGANVQQCVKDRQQEATIRALCKKDPDVRNQSINIQECITREEKRIGQKLLEVDGVLDPTLKFPMKARFEKGQFFPSEIIWDGQQRQFPINFIIDNPRDEKITTEFECSFSKGNEQVPGKIITPTQPLSSSQKVIRTLVTCESENLATLLTDKKQSNIKVQFTATFRDLKSKSRLQRAFVAPIDFNKQEEIESFTTLEADIKQLHFSGSEHLSRAPPDFAQLQFAIGNPPQNPVVTGDPLALTATVRNAGPGEIIAIKEYHFNLNGFIPTSGNDCLLGQAPGSKSTIYLPFCTLDYPQELKEPTLDYALREYTADITYDYNLTTSTSITVRSQS